MTHVCLRELGQHFVRLSKGLLGLTGANHVFEESTEVLVQPAHAAFQFAPLTSSNDDHPVTQLAEPEQPFPRALNGWCIVEAVGLVEFLDLSKSLIGGTPARVLSEVGIIGRNTTGRAEAPPTFQ